MFTRFVVGMDGEDHRLLTGVVTEAQVLRDAEKLFAHEEERLQEIYDWFDDNLPAPAFSAGRYPADAVAWFKTDSEEFIGRMWDLVAILQNHDVAVRLLRSPDPGKIVYEDPYQVLVEEWRHL